MAGETGINKNHRFLELKDGPKSFGKFNFDDIELGTEGGDFSIDPDLGELPRAGIDTTGEFDINRDWEKTREPKLKDDLAAIKNSYPIQAFVWTIDPRTKQTVTSEPEDTFTVMVRKVVIPGGDANSADKTQIVVGVKPLTPRKVLA